MYTPKAFREPDVDANLDFVEQQGFGALIGAGAEGPVITHLPVLVDRDQGRLCLLRAHVAKANDHWRSLDDRPATMVFSGPHCYISAGWYRERKVVPTWNYVAVHLHGTARRGWFQESMKRAEWSPTSSTTSKLEASIPGPSRRTSANSWTTC